MRAVLHAALKDKPCDEEHALRAILKVREPFYTAAVSLAAMGQRMAQTSNERDALFSCRSLMTSPSETYDRDVERPCDSGGGSSKVDVSRGHAV
jgi:hypothetical protein